MLRKEAAGGDGAADREMRGGREGGMLVRMSSWCHPTTHHPPSSSSSTHPRSGQGNRSSRR